MMLKNVAYLINFVWNVFATHIPSHYVRYFMLRYIFRAKLGKGVSIGRGVKLFHPWKLKVGAGSNIQYKSFIDCRGSVEIGSNVDITMFVTIISQDHDIHSADYSTRDRPVKIQSDAVIGTRAIVLPGANLCRGTVIGAGSCIGGKTREYSVYFGNPARFHKERGNCLGYNVSYQRPFH